jgi:putative transposase
MKGKPKPTDLSDQQWAMLEPLIPAATFGGAAPSVNLPQVINAIF